MFPMKDTHPADKYNFFGIRFFNNGEYNKALIELKKVRHINENFSIPFYIGMLFQKQGKYHRAIKEFKKVSNV